MRRILPYILFTCAGIVFYRNCVVDGGGDFRVYWKIARRVLDGGPAYLPSADIPMAYKYPPWTLPVFFPLAALPYEWARRLWAAASVVAMYGSFAWILRVLRCSAGSLAVALALTWGLWAAQFNHGQVNALVLAGLLGFWRPGLPEASAWRSVGLLFVATTKIISVYPLLAYRSLRPWLKPALWAAGLFALLALPAWLNSEPPRALTLLRDWRTVAGSAVQGFSPEFARSRMNQGLPVLVGRAFAFHSMSDLPEQIGVLVAGTAVALGWRRLSRGLAPEEAWAGWVAWICVVGPLSWSHNFVLALPLLSMAVDRAWRSGRKGPLALALLGLVLTGPLTFNAAVAIGTWIGSPYTFLVPTFIGIEHLSVKSLGLLTCAGAFLWARGPDPQAPCRPEGRV